MSNAIFPTLIGLGWNVVWSPSFNTRIKTATSGKEYRSQLMASPLYNFSLSYDLIRHGTSQELRTIYGFFLERQGSFDSFLYLNPDDSTVTDQLIGTGNNSNKNFQLMRSFGSAFLEPVQNSVIVTNVKVNGNVQTPGSQYTVSSTGLVIFTNAPSSGLPVTWTGSYYYRCRFLKDELTFNKFMKNFWELKKLEMIGSLGTKI